MNRSYILGGLTLFTGSIYFCMKTYEYADNYIFYKNPLIKLNRDVSYINGELVELNITLSKCYQLFYECKPKYNTKELMESLIRNLIINGKQDNADKLFTLWNNELCPDDPLH